VLLRLRLTLALTLALAVAVTDRCTLRLRVDDRETLAVALALTLRHGVDVGVGGTLRDAVTLALALKLRHTDDVIDDEMLVDAVWLREARLTLAVAVTLPLRLLLDDHDALFADADADLDALVDADRDALAVPVALTTAVFDSDGDTLAVLLALLVTTAGFDRDALTVLLRLTATTRDGVGDRDVAGVTSTPPPPPPRSGRVSNTTGRPCSNPDGSDTVKAVTTSALAGPPASGSKADAPSSSTYTSGAVPSSALASEPAAKSPLRTLITPLTLCTPLTVTWTLLPVKSWSSSATATRMPARAVIGTAAVTSRVSVITHGTLTETTSGQPPARSWLADAPPLRESGAGNSTVPGATQNTACMRILTTPPAAVVTWVIACSFGVLDSTLVAASSRDTARRASPAATPGSTA
jgi:hypothetical protein